MPREDRETIICLNRADMRDGFFVFGTSEATDFRRLCRRIGGPDNLRRLKVSMCEGTAVWWDCEVPVEYMSRRTWGIGKRKGRKPPTSTPVPKNPAERPDS